MFHLHCLYILQVQFYQQLEYEDRSEQDTDRLFKELTELEETYKPSTEIWDSFPTVGRRWPMFGYMMRFQHWTIKPKKGLLYSAGKQKRVMRHIHDDDKDWECAHCGNLTPITEFLEHCNGCLRQRTYFWNCSLCADGDWNIVGVEMNCYFCQSPKGATDAVSYHLTLSSK